MINRIFVLIAASYLVMSSTIFSQTGSSGLAFLKFGVGGRPLGMGEAYSAIIDDPSATYYNPAAVSAPSSVRLLVMHRESVQDMRTEFIVAITSWNDIAWGLSVNSSTITNNEFRTIPGPPMGTFDAQNAAIGLTGAIGITPEIRFGTTVKFLYEKIFVDEASGYAFDFGGWYRTPWDIRLGLTAANIGSMSALRTTATTLPLTLRLGGAYQLDIENSDGEATFTSDLVTFPREHKTHVNIGTEFCYKQAFAIRLGYQTGYETRSISAGTGFMYGIFNFDYAFVPYRQNFGTAHTFSLGINFQ